MSNVMTVFHISPSDGNVRKCVAKKYGCKFGIPLKEHFTDREDAIKVAEFMLNNEFGMFSKSLSKEKTRQKLSDDTRIVLSDPEHDFDEARYSAISAQYMFSLNDIEQNVMERYVQNLCDDLNEPLWRGREVPVEFQEDDKTLNSALHKYGGKVPEVLWRSLPGMNLQKDFAERGYKVGDSLTFPGYSSTSETLSNKSGAAQHLLSENDYYLNFTPEDEQDWVEDSNGWDVLNVPEDFAVDNIMFKMSNVKTAAPVSMARNRATEQEWLIPKNTEYTITKIERVRIFQNESEVETVSSKKNSFGAQQPPRRFMTIYHIEQV